MARLPPERSQGAASLVDRHAEVRTPSLLPQPEDPRTQLPNPRGKKNMLDAQHFGQNIRLYNARIHFCFFPPQKKVIVVIDMCCVCCLCSSELYVRLPRRWVGEAPRGRDGQTSVRRRVWDQRNRFPGQSYATQAELKRTPSSASFHFLFYFLIP